MPTILFTRHLRKHVPAPPATTDGQTVREILAAVFAANPAARSFILDDHDALRKQFVVFVDGKMVEDRQTLSDPVGPQSEVYIMQALSGG